MERGGNCVAGGGQRDDAGGGPGGGGTRARQTGGGAPRLGLSPGGERVMSEPVPVIEEEEAGGVGEKVGLPVRRRHDHLLEGGSRRAAGPGGAPAPEEPGTTP